MSGIDFPDHGNPPGVALVMLVEHPKIANRPVKPGRRKEQRRTGKHIQGSGQCHNELSQSQTSSRRHSRRRFHLFHALLLRYRAR